MLDARIAQTSRKEPLESKDPVWLTACSSARGRMSTSTTGPVTRRTGETSWVVTWVVVALATALFGCTNEKLYWAPRTTDIDRPEKSVDQVQLLEIGKPKCDYQVIGSAFGRSLDTLVEVAAAHGGDGVYDPGCSSKIVGGVMASIDLRHAQTDCGGRVYVCR
jgi:hypothetical protein